MLDNHRPFIRQYIEASWECGKCYTAEHERDCENRNGVVEAGGGGVQGVGGFQGAIRRVGEKAKGGPVRRAGQGLPPA